MRRVMHKPLKKSDARRIREEAAEERPAGRPEVRKDIARTWWPEG
ncbi:hypothetical protein AB0K92_20780 [Streptomyces sp. NPDC052687]|nr:hypothetical protein [Streptomyces sp. JB150]